MDKILFILDSPCDITHEQTEGRNIRIAPVTVTINGVTRRDYYDIKREEFWGELDVLQDVPATAMVMPDKFLEMFLQAREDGFTHIIVIVISSTGAGTFNSATLAKTLFQEEHGGGSTVKIVDSKGYSFMYGRMAVEGAELVAAGASFDEVLKHIYYLIPRSQGLMWVYNLNYLKKSGRISGMSAFVGETLGIRPILWIRDGFINPIEKVRGDKNLIPKVMEICKEYIENPHEQDMYLLYADTPEEEIARCESMALEHIRPRSLVRHPIGVSISINTGPHAMALAFKGYPVILQES